MAALEELGTLLLSLQALKAPGITKSKIEAITKQCVENVQSDTEVVDKIVQYFHSSPATHKLGVLYVVDSVARQWLDRAKKTGQAVSRNAAPGTFASGVQKMTDKLPNIMADILRTAPEAQNDKISKLLDIWQRSLTFPSDMLAGFKKQLEDKSKTFTPPGSPPKVSAAAAAPTYPVYPTNQIVAPVAPPAPPAQDQTAMLAALVGLSAQNAQTNPVPAVPQPYNFAQNVVPPAQNYALPQPPPVNVQPTAPPAASHNINEIAGQILQAMQLGTISGEQGLQVLTALAASQNGGNPLLPTQTPVAPVAPPALHNDPYRGRFEQSSNGHRDRSRSPGYNHNTRSPRRSPTNRRDSPTYGVYDPSANKNEDDSGDFGRGRGINHGGRNDFRQRSPPRRQPSPVGNGPYNGAPKFLEWDMALPRDNIKVLSRTLFVGGASGSEQDIRSIFSRFGKVQTCIVNHEKRHAFVKMLTRPDAVAAKDGMDGVTDPIILSKARQTRWGVGFGPRDCSDYAVGISVIPIARLTDADRKWVVSAENGGTGGRTLEGGMVLEEPDIEIGAGVSSKAISRRVPPEAGRGGRGGFTARGGGSVDNKSRYRQPEKVPAQEPRHPSPRPPPAVAVPPAVPGFGFQLPGMTGFR